MISNLNMDFDRRVVVDTWQKDWLASPMAGVWRKPLAREEAERGHATSIVRYEPGARFSVHDHPKGEEILVLEGTFSDESGDYHAGTYFRNPEGFCHAPFSEPGCVILVKLHQFQPQDSHHLCLDSHSATWQQDADGVRILPLHRFGSESVSLVRLPDGGQLPPAEGGEELYVIEGRWTDALGSCDAGTWTRTPADQRLPGRASGNCLLWRKTGHF